MDYLLGVVLVGWAVCSKDGTTTDCGLLLSIIHLIVFLVAFHVVQVVERRSTLHFVSKCDFVLLVLFIDSVSLCVSSLKR